MGRKTKNKVEKIYLAFKEGASILRYHVKLPFIFCLTMTPTEKEQTGEETRLFFVKPESNLDGVIKEFESNYPYKIIKSEQYTERWTDLCPKCRRSGIPKIEKKDSHDRRTRRPTHLGETEKNKIQVERPYEFWLTYIHRTVIDDRTTYPKCRICQYVIITGTYPAYKKNPIEIKKYFFPHILENMKKGSIWYTD